MIWNNSFVKLNRKLSPNIFIQDILKKKMESFIFNINTICTIFSDRIIVFLIFKQYIYFDSHFKSDRV